MKLKDNKSVKGRRKALEQELGISLCHIGTYSIDEKQASSTNCENMVGATQIPLGVAGPLCVKSKVKSSKSKNNKSYYYIPLATTEGALVASVNRGCKAIAEAGGAFTTSRRVGVTRGPAFFVPKSDQQGFIEYVNSKKHYFDSLAKQTSKHIALLGVQIQSRDAYVFVRFSFDTQDAMGMNMATFATDRIVKHIESITNAQCVSLSGNVCVDKKASIQNMVHGRGYMVSSSVLLSNALVNKILKTTVKKLYKTWHAKCVVGSELAGLLGNNAHTANIIAALFAATGQDIAHTVEGSLGTTTIEKYKGAVKVSVYLPSIMVGTVGGGTSLATQQEALTLLGLAGGNNGKHAHELSRVVGGAVLAGEVSLLASLSEGTLAWAHKTFARRKEQKL